jgi:hypothetical protein
MNEETFELRNELEENLAAAQDGGIAGGHGYGTGDGPAIEEQLSLDSPVCWTRH